MTEARAVEPGQESVSSAPVPTPLPQRLPALTSLRFFAALWVVLYHYDKDLLPAFPWARSFIHAGSTGVSLFYVLSGFILAHTYWDRDVRSTKGRRDFFVHRLARIYPMYLASLAVMLPRLIIERNEPIVRYAYDHPWLVTLSHLTLTTPWFFYPVPVLNAPTWSVGCEAGFYLLFPSLIPLIRRTGARSALIAMGLIFALSVVLPWMYAQGLFFDGPRIWGWADPAECDARANQAIRMWPIFRLGEFAIGMLVAAYLRHRPAWGSRARTVLLGSVLLFALAFVGAQIQSAGSSQTVLLVQQVYPVPFFAALIAALALYGGTRPRWLSAPFLLLLGEASYSLYLIHIPVKHALRLVGDRVGVPLETPLGVAATILLTIPASILAFRLVESPARRWIAARYAPRVTMPPATTSA